MASLERLKGKISVPGFLSVEAKWGFDSKKAKERKGDPLSVDSHTGFLIINKMYNLVLDIHWETQWRAIYRCECHKDVNQHWSLYQVDLNTTVITSRYTERCMTVEGAALHDGAVVRQDQYEGSLNQEWIIEELEDYSYSIRARHSGKYLDMLENPTPDDHTAIVQWHWHGGDNQRWWLKPTY